MSTPRKRTSTRANLNHAPETHTNDIPNTNTGEASRRSSHTRSSSPTNAKRRRTNTNIPLLPHDDDALFDEIFLINADNDAPDGVIDLRPGGGDDAAAAARLKEKEKEEEEEARERERERKQSWVRLAAFQCAICMDDVHHLVVTHCGHMFCQGCLSQALDTQNGRFVHCPMCRQKIEMKSRESYSIKTKGFWQLRIKVRKPDGSTDFVSPRAGSSNPA